MMMMMLLMELLISPLSARLQVIGDQATELGRERKGNIIHIPTAFLRFSSFTWIGNFQLVLWLRLITRVLKWLILIILPAVLLF